MRGGLGATSSHKACSMGVAELPRQTLMGLQGGVGLRLDSRYWAFLALNVSVPGAKLSRVELMMATWPDCSSLYQVFESWMHQWLLFEMSKNSLEEKPTEAPPKGRSGFQGARALELLLGPLECWGQGLQLSQSHTMQPPILSIICLSCLFLLGLAALALSHLWVSHHTRLVV